MLKGTLGVAVVTLLLLTACARTTPLPPRLRIDPDASWVLAGVADVEQVAQLTGPSSINRTDAYGVAGTDLGSMFNVADRTYFVFGDTFGYRTPGMSGGGGQDWRSNAMAVTTDDEPSEGITFDGFISDASGRAIELIPARKQDRVEITCIPTHGIAVGSTMYLYFMSVNHWGPPGVWMANYSGMAKSVDEGQSWEVLEEPRWDGAGNFIQVSPVKIRNDDGTIDIYFWSIPAGRFGGVQLMKVPETEIERMSSYRYFAGTAPDGSPVWREDPDEAVTIVDDRVGELSVMWNEYLERWIMTYLGGPGDLILREGLTPWGPWGDPITVLTQQSDPGLYGPFMNPRYVEKGGETVYFALSRWGPYNVYWMRMRLVKQ